MKVTVEGVLWTVWISMGIIGAIWMAYKGYFSWVSNLGCAAWILGGWLGLIIALGIVMFRGESCS